MKKLTCSVYIFVTLGLAMVAAADQTQLAFELPSIQDREDTWNYSVIDSSGTVDWLSMDLDIWNLPHIAYSKDEQIWYAHRDAGVWEWETEQIAATGWKPCIALGPDQKPRIVYIIPENMLAIATWNGSDWVVEEYSDFGSALRYPLIAIDQDGGTHLAYYIYMDWDPYELRYAFNDGEEWLRLELECYGENYSVTPMSIALDSCGNPRIAGIKIYIDDMDYDQYFLRLYERGDSPYSWEVNTLVSFYCRGRPAVAAGPDGISAVAYQWTTGTEQMMYHEHPGTYSGVYSEGDSPTLTFDSQGKPHLAFCTGGTIKYAVREDATWELTNLPHGAYYWGIELELDQYDQPHIAMRIFEGLAYIWKGDPTGIESAEPESYKTLIVSVYPSPAAEKVSVLLNSETPGTVNVLLYDLAGRTVISGHAELNGQCSSSVQLDLESLPSGIYVINATLGELSDRTILTVMK